MNITTFGNINLTTIFNTSTIKSYLPTSTTMSETVTNWGNSLGSTWNTTKDQWNTFNKTLAYEELREWTNGKVMDMHKWTVDHQDEIAWALMITSLILFLVFVRIMRRIVAWNRQTNVVHRNNIYLKKQCQVLNVRCDTMKKSFSKATFTEATLRKTIKDHESTIVELRGEIAKLKDRNRKLRTKNKNLKAEIQDNELGDATFEGKLSEIQATLLDPSYTDEDDLLYNSKEWSRKKLRDRADELCPLDFDPAKWKCRSNLAAYVRALEQLNIISAILEGREYERPGSYDDDPDWSPGDE